MKKSVFSTLLLCLVTAAAFASGDQAEVYCKYKKIANGVFLKDDLLVTTDNILLYNNIYFKEKDENIYDYRIVFVDRVTKLVFVRFDTDSSALEIPPDNILVDGEPIFVEHEGKKKKVGIFTRKINGYGAFYSNDKLLFEGTAIYDVEGAFAGILLGKLNESLYLFIYSDMLAFYRDNIDNIRNSERPKLNILVTELWEYPGIRVKESANRAIMKDDVIIKVDSFLVNNVLDFNRALYFSAGKKKFVFTVIRNNMEKIVTVHGG